MGRDYTKIATALIPPSAGATGGSLLSACDPTLSGLLTAFKAILNTKLNTAWQAAAAGFSSNVVEDAEAIDPLPGEANLTWNWPALFLYRGETRFSERTMQWDGEETDLYAVYVLPPLSQDQVKKLSHIRVAVKRTLRTFVQNKGDASQGDTNLLDTLGIDALELVDADYGEAFEREMQTEGVHPAIRMHFVLKEREMPYTDYLDSMTAVATTIQSADADGETDLVETEYDPTA